MNSYSIYGGCLWSDVPFPALPAGRGRADWVLRRVRGAPPAGVFDVLGTDRVDPAVHVRLFRHPGGFRLVYDDTGTFDVSDDGARIDWYPPSDASMEAVQLDVLGRVLPTALHALGALCLHGSAVTIDDSGVAFLGPKHHGKSTLARAIAQAGACVLSDDVVAVDVEPAPAMRPGVGRVRLWRDSATQLGAGPEAAMDAYGKFIMSPPAGAPVTRERVPVGAIYLIMPVAPDGRRAAATRTALLPVHATMGLLPQARLAALLGKTEARILLDRVVRLAHSSPVYALEIVRELDRLPEAAELVRSWHAQDARHTATVSCSA